MRRKQCIAGLATTIFICYGISQTTDYLRNIRLYVNQKPCDLLKTRNGLGCNSQDEPEKERFDVLLNSYMRSGSTITGHLLGHRDDVFYFYEPLRQYNRLSYFKGKDTCCQVLRPKCWQLKSRRYEPIDFLRAIYNCSFDTDDGMKRLISKINLHMYEKSGASWSKLLECKNNTNTYYDCVSSLVPDCKTAMHRVTKVVRLSLDNTETLLRENTRLKVVHLFRDPRGIINSEIKTKWFPFSGKKEEAVKNNSIALCDRLLNDIKAGKQLIETFPDRVLIIQYEEFCDTVSLARYLYDFVGMTFTEEHKKFANTSDTLSATAKTDGYHPFAFRDSLPWQTVRTIDSVCQEVYRELGYTSFNNEDDFRNHSLALMRKCRIFMDET